MMEHKTNSDIRISNTKRLVNLIFRKGQMTKQEMALQLGISQPTVATIIKDLEAKGLVRDGEVMDSTGGRKPLCHVPVYDAKYSIGVESGREVVRMVILDLGNNSVAYEEHELERNYCDAYWKQINDWIKEFIKSSGIEVEKILSVGITIDETMKEGNVISSHESMPPVDMEAAASQFEFEVFFSSSAKMAAIAQIWTQEERDHFVYLSLGSNIRGAMVLQKQVVDFDAVNCEFGYILGAGETAEGKKKLLDSLSANTLLKRAGVKHLQELKEKLDANDEQCISILNEYIDILSTFLFNLHMIFGWDIVIGGRLTPLIVYNRELIEDKIYELCKWEGVKKSFFEISKIGEKSAVIGAALLPIDRYLSAI